MKKITFVFFICLCTVGFSQSQLSTVGDNNPVVLGTSRAVQQTPVSIETNVSAQSLSSLVEERQVSNSASEELQAAAIWNATNAPINFSTTTSLLADIIPTAGATETFTPAVGDNFFDPGGPGGSTTGGTPGNYPNCNCDTVTTLSGVTEIEFLEFDVFATFDYLRIYDGPDTSGPVLFDNATGGANAGDISLGDMIASNGSASFVGTSGSLTFFFHSSSVVDRAGWNAEVIAGAAPVVFPAPYCGPLDFPSDVEPMTLVEVAGISNVSDATVGGSPGHEDFTLIVGAMEEGMTYPIALEGNTAGPFTSRFVVFIDWNQNDVLDDAGEVYEIAELIVGSTGTDGQQATGDIVVPAGVTPGDTRMRVKKIFGTTGYLDPCLGTGFGQAEDYTITVTAAGGGGSVACEQSDVSNAFENGYGNTVAGVEIADEIIVAADTDFEVNQLTVNIINNGGFNDVIVAFYADNAGVPGAQIGAFETVVPTSSTVIGAAFGRDVNEIVLDITPVMLSGTAGAETVYWIGIETPNPVDPVTDAFWETTSVVNAGTDYAVAYDVSNGGWTSTLPADLTQNTVYIASGECTPMGGGGAPCDQSDVSNAFENGYGNTVAGVEIADEIIVAADTDFEVNQLTVNIINNGGFNDVIVAFYADNAGVPGAQIGAFETVVPTSSTVIGAAFGRDVNEIVLDITPVMLPGAVGAETVYWIGIETPNPVDPVTDAFWETTSVVNAGTDYAVAYDVSNGGWTSTLPADLTQNTVYIASGECTPIGVPADNDTCDDATAVACGDVVVSDTLTNTDTGGNAAPDEWFKFTGTGNTEVVTLSLCDGGTDFDTVLRVFSDCTMATEVAFNDDSCGLQSEVSFLSDGTSTYYIMVEGFGTGSGNFSLAVSCVPTLVNDNCDGALPIACGEMVAGTTTGATSDAASVPTCDVTVTAPGVWYKYEDTTGLITDITVTLCEGTTAFDTKLSVYTGDCGAPPLTCVAGNDDSCGLQSEVTFQSDGASTFYILVHGFGSASGDFELTMNCTPVPPPNDMIANSIDVDEAGFPYTDPSVAMPAATTEAGTPAGCDNAGAKGVWYNFVPVGDGEATATITSPAGVSSVTFYTAPDENSVETDLVLVDWYLNQCLPGTSASIPTVAGQAYYVYVVNHGGVTDIQIDGDGLGVADNTIEGFSYYPNPADTTINLNSVDTIESVTVFNMLGQKVIDQTINATTSQLDVSKLATGAYLLQVSVNGQRGTYRILKN